VDVYVNAELRGSGHASRTPRLVWLTGTWILAIETGCQNVSILIIFSIREPMPDAPIYAILVMSGGEQLRSEPRT
jgi:hypothetical protein